MIKMLSKYCSILLHLQSNQLKNLLTNNPHNVRSEGFLLIKFSTMLLTILNIISKHGQYLFEKILYIHVKGYFVLKF